MDSEDVFDAIQSWKTQSDEWNKIKRFFDEFNNDKLQKVVLLNKIKIVRSNTGQTYADVYIAAIKDLLK